MTSAFSNLKFELIGTGDQSGLWGQSTNTNIGTAIEQALVGMATLTSANFTANVATLLRADTNAAQNFRALCLNIASGAVSAAGTINVPAIEKPYIVINNSSFTVTVKVSGQTGVAVPAGKRTVVYNDGVDVGNQIDFLTGLTLGTALPVASGGSGATTASAARTNFGATTLGGNLFTITNPSAVTFPRFNADNTVSSLNAADFRTAIGAGTGGGSVTSVAGTGTANGLTLSGTVTSSGNITLSGSVTSLTTTNFTIVEEGGKLVIKYQGTVVASLSSAGALIAKDNVSGFTTP